MGWLRKRFSEPSSWAGVGAILTTGAQAYGDGGKYSAIAAILAGIAAFLLPEKKNQ